MNDGEVDTTKTKTNRARAVFGLEHSHKLQLLSLGAATP